MNLTDSYTSTGAKFFAHEEAMRNLRDGQGQPIVTHLMPTDICNHTCAFCSVQTRDGDTLTMDVMMGYLDILLKRGLKAVIISGGGNPILWKDPANRAIDFNDLVAAIHNRGLEIGLITNGRPLEEVADGRQTWKGIRPETLDKLTWVRISMSGLDHRENQVYVPDLAGHVRLGFSYVLHDIYEEPLDKNHGKVSRPEDIVTKDRVLPVRWGLDRVEDLNHQIGNIVKEHDPAYIRLLPNCLEPRKINDRVELLQGMANVINEGKPTAPVFVQYKPPSAPSKCYLGYVHPVLNSDGYVYPCDSCVLNETADHKFASPWRVCRWDEVDKIYQEPIRSLIKDPSAQCPGCVFPETNKLLEGIATGAVPLGGDLGSGLSDWCVDQDHANFV